MPSSAPEGAFTTTLVCLLPTITVVLCVEPPVFVVTLVVVGIARESAHGFNRRALAVDSRASRSGGPGRRGKSSFFLKASQ